ncbi:unnamed protein product [Pedinophyceae sp. YPF-701]|nr:unnamed protein product [Pedinophyceae sp. YPF-701]
MKFKAVLTERGRRALDRAFLPTLEKFGKTCQLLLSPTETHVVVPPDHADGALIVAKMATNVLFAEGTLVCSSKCNDYIAFSTDTAVLIRVLRNLHDNDCETIEMKLTNRATAVPNTSDTIRKPYLSFYGTGVNVNVVQDVEISRPFKPGDVEALVDQINAGDLCDFYLDLLPEVSRLSVVLERLRSISPALSLSATHEGDLHLQARSSGVSLGAEISGIDVRPDSVASTARPLREDTAEGRLREAKALGQAVSAEVNLRHVKRALDAAPLTVPMQMLCGINPHAGVVHIMFAYADPNASDMQLDESLDLAMKLPLTVSAEEDDD